MILVNLVNACFIYHLVNGFNKDNIKYNYCSVSIKLENMCGKEGKMYKKNI
jgi:hypothetical protein